MTNTATDKIDALLEEEVVDYLRGYVRAKPDFTSAGIDWQKLAQEEIDSRNRKALSGLSTESLEQIATARLNFDLLCRTVKSALELPYKCPNCKCTDGLGVQIKGYASLAQSEDKGAYADITEIEQLSDDFEDDSLMLCIHCGHGGIASDFENPDHNI